VDDNEEERHIFGRRGRGRYDRVETPLSENNQPPLPPRHLKSNAEVKTLLHQDTSSPSSHLPMRTGHWTKAEKLCLTNAFTKYCDEHNIVDDEIDRLLHPAKFGDRNLFRGVWFEIAQSVPGRKVIAVYQQAHRMFSNVKRGPWSDEERQQLDRLVAKHGCVWAKIGSLLNRLPDACRDRYRANHSTNKGEWSTEEELLLKDAVKTCTDRHPQNINNEVIFWTSVAKIVGTRNYDQCRKKWRMLHRVSNSEWTEADTTTLVKRLYETAYHEESEISWYRISDGLKWNPNQCWFRWNQLKKSFDQTLPFDSVIEKLYNTYNTLQINQETKDEQEQQEQQKSTKKQKQKETKDPTKQKTEKNKIKQKKQENNKKKRKFLARKQDTTRKKRKTDQSKT